MIGKFIVWLRNKFAAAWAGIAWASRADPSFRVHLPAAVIVILVASALGVEPWRWAVLILAIGGVIATELFNTAIEQLVRVIHPSRDRAIGRALDAAAGGVLVATIAAVVIGLMTLAPPIYRLLSGD